MINELLRFVMDNFWIIFVSIIMAIDKRFRAGSIVLIFTVCIMDKFKYNVFVWGILECVVLVTILIFYESSETYFRAKYDNKYKFKYYHNKLYGKHFCQPINKKNITTDTAENK